MNSVQSQDDADLIDLPKPPAECVQVTISLARFGGETSNAERQAIAGILMQAAQLIGSGQGGYDQDTHLRDNQGQIVGGIVWGYDTVTGAPPPEPPPEGEAQAASATTYADEEFEDEEEDAREAAKHKTSSQQHHKK